MEILQYPCRLRFLMGATRFLLVRWNNTATYSPRLFSSSAVMLQPRIHDREASEELDRESVVYKSKLKLQRPTTVQYNESSRNSVSLIGEIVLPLKACNSNKFGVHTLLKVKNSTGGHYDFEVMLMFWDEMAEVSVQHLKPNDLLYVSGRLGSYTKVDEDGMPLRKYKVDVSEMNIVSYHCSVLAVQKSTMFEQVSAEDIMQKRRERLHTWQLFFANPYEWWDNRKCKSHPRAPDFRHKDTGEALWISDSDPPWVKKQLQLTDSRLVIESTVQRRNASLNLSPLVYDDDRRT